MSRIRDAEKLGWKINNNIPVAALNVKIGNWSFNREIPIIELLDCNLTIEYVTERVIKGVIEHYFNFIASLK